MNKFTIILCILLLLPLTVSAEWLVCDQAPENLDSDTGNDVVNVVIIQDGAEIIRPYEVDVSGYVYLIDTTVISQAHFDVGFENAQGRRSDLVPFDLKPPPSSCSNLRLQR